MSKSIIIQKNGVAQTLTVDKLRLPDAAGGTKNWLPADGKNLVNLEVKQNGTYKASDFGAYGIAEVKVKCTLNGGAATPKATEKPLNALHHPAPAEGGRARTMSAHHLETPQDGGGTVQWVPEAEVALGTKSVNIDNRNYKASDDGKYGYSEFTVSGISITKDGDTITHTDGTGTKTYTLPHHIRVEHPPLKTAYVDGETIDFFDMLVKAYNEDGTVWTDETHPGGVIPLEELILPVTVADYDAQIKTIYNVDAAGTHLLDMKTSGWPDPRSYSKTNDGQAYFAFVYITGDDWNMPILISTTRDAAYETIRETNSGGTVVESITGPNRTVTREGVDFYANTQYALHGTIENADRPIYSYFPSTGLAVSYLIDKIIAGETSGGGQEIPVQWARPWDGEILEDSFVINVTRSYGGAEGGGGQTSGGGAGRDN